ncbi:Fe-S cluster assembly protein SufD (nucleomorph) [Chroomonas mesostigmatica CCMP1168]|uniref:Fe-S cluster assembly protein SufD n=1 Tax=Chroomonas mesostigmatica CCMP1168 TaxID=1195612 RepID=J7G348_9CRYP|nr:Fe-S cluster assembly protein SufD [Chroomonas mesostigmatica CCMP1168]
MNFVTPFKCTTAMFFGTNISKIYVDNSFLKNKKISLKNSFFRKKFFYDSFKMNTIRKLDSSTDKSKWLDSILLSKKVKKTSFINNLRKIGLTLLKNTRIPSKKDESWRFTSLDQLFNMEFSDIIVEENDDFVSKYIMENSVARIVFINGVFSFKFSSLDPISKKFLLQKFSELDIEKQKKISKLIGKGESGINGGFFPILNMACLDEIVVLSLSSDLRLEKPIQIVFAGSKTKNPVCLNQKIIVLGEKHAKATVIEQHVSSDDSEFFDNSTTNIFLEEGAELNYVVSNQISQKASIVLSIHAELQKNSSLNFLSASIGGFLSRMSLGIDLNGSGSNCNIQGITVASNNQLSDIHSRISHNYPYSTSSQLHKNLVSGKASAVFAGKVQVHNGAFDTESDQLCKTLLLSPTSKIDSMPILEINNQNVKCTHGSTVSDLDDEQIFYFQSRGISVEKARFLLTLGFVKEMIEKFPKELVVFFSEFLGTVV